MQVEQRQRQVALLQASIAEQKKQEAVLVNAISNLSVIEEQSKATGDQSSTPTTANPGLMAAAMATGVANQTANQSANQTPSFMMGGPSPAAVAAFQAQYHAAANVMLARVYNCERMSPKLFSLIHLPRPEHLQPPGLCRCKEMDGGAGGGPGTGAGLMGSACNDVLHAYLAATVARGVRGLPPKELRLAEMQVRMGYHNFGQMV